MSEVRTNWNKGQPIPAKDVRAASEALAGLIRSGQDITSRRGGFVGNDARHVVKITAVTIIDESESATLVEYEFEQVRWDTTTTDWIAATNPITHESLGKIVSQGRLDSTHAGVDDIVTIRPGSRTDADGRTQWEFVPSGNQWYFAKVTASSPSYANITLAEVDSAGDVIDGGRAPEDARVLNDRRGVPEGTYGIAFELPPTTADGDVVTKFDPWDGLTTNPADLTKTTEEIDTTDWNVEDQQKADPTASPPVLAQYGVEFDPSRVLLDFVNTSDPAMFHFDRPVLLDGNGYAIFVDGERGTFLAADPDDTHKDLHITLIPTIINEGSADEITGDYIKLNQPQAEESTVTFNPGANVTINGIASPSPGPTISFDDSGRRCDAAGGAVAAGDTSITIAAVAGAGDGQGYEFVDHNGANVGTEPDNGTINFKDNGTTPTLPDIEVAWTVTNNAGTDTVDVEGKVTLPVEDNYPSSVDVEVVTDVRIDETNKKLQKKTRTVTVLKTTAESAWTDVHTGEECA